VSLIPDLLHPTPISRVDEESLRAAIALAFASGVAGGLFGDTLDKARISASTFEPASFIGDLFVPTFVARCFRIKVGGADALLSTTHLVRILTQPPSDRAVVDHRRAIASELVASPELREELERLYLLLVRFRGLLEGATGTGKWDPNRRHLDLLGFVKEIIDKTATGFGASKSGLVRLAEFGKRVQASEPYRSLADLLRYDEQLATLNLKVRVGADGRIRGFQVLSIQEDQENPFVTSPARRWLSKVELFVRGFHFSDGEVMARLIDAVFDGIQNEIVRFVQLFGDIELYLGAMGFRDLAKESGLDVCLPTLVGPRDPRKVEALFNPLLLVHGIKPVPCTLDSDRHDTIVLLTGPNSGGKTRLLQSLGLMQLLAQSGLFVPAKSASLALVPSLVVSLIQETKADQAEGRLGMELVRIRELFERLPPGAMVILDELCSGTNPSEGEEIFELVVRMLEKLEPQAWITTHFLAFAARLDAEKKIAALRFLQVVLGPDQQATYQFAPGVAHTSLAGQAAARLGVTGDQLMSLIDRNIAKAKTAG
jgi:DNA mismatch repair protein MutS2